MRDVQKSWKSEGHCEYSVSCTAIIRIVTNIIVIPVIGKQIARDVNEYIGIKQIHVAMGASEHTSHCS